MNQTLPISEVRAKLPKLVELAASVFQKTFINVKGKSKAVIISTEEFESMLETIDVLSNKKEVEAIKRGLEDIKHGRLVDWEDIKKGYIK